MNTNFSTDMNRSVNPQYSQGSVDGPGSYGGGKQSDIQSLQKEIKSLKDQIAAQGQQGSGGAQGGGGESDMLTKLMELLKTAEEKLGKLMGGQGMGADTGGDKSGGGSIQAGSKQPDTGVSF